MMRSDRHLVRLMCHGEKARMEKCVKDVMAAVEALPSWREILWSPDMADVNVIEVARRTR